MSSSDATKKLGKKELRSLFLRSFSTSHAWHFERQQHMAFCWSMIPAIKKLYDRPEDRIAAYQRHLEFYNCHTTMQPLIGGIVCAMTLVLATIRIPLPTGSNITCGSWIPLMLLALLYDYRLSMLSGWVCGILAMILIPGWQAVHWAQIFVQQLVCFSCLGYAGVFGSDKRWKAICGMALAVAIRCFGHVISGVIFYSQNAWDGWGAWGYSLAFNLSSRLPEGILSILSVSVLPLTLMRRAIARREAK